MKQRLRNSWLDDSPNADVWRLTGGERARLVERMKQLRADASEWSEHALWVPLHLEDGIREVISHLIERDYDWLVSSGRLDRSSLEGLRNEIEGYPATFVPPPTEAFLVADYWQSTAENDAEGLVEMPLWTVEEGPSDLEARLVVRSSGRIDLYDVVVS